MTLRKRPEQKHSNHWKNSPSNPDRPGSRCLSQWVAMPYLTKVSRKLIIVRHSGDVICQELSDAAQEVEASIEPMNLPYLLVDVREVNSFPTLTSTCSGSSRGADNHHWLRDSLSLPTKCTLIPSRPSPWNISREESRFVSSVENWRHLSGYFNHENRLALQANR